MADETWEFDCEVNGKACNHDIVVPEGLSEDAVVNLHDKRFPDHIAEFWDIKGGKFTKNAVIGHQIRHDENVNIDAEVEIIASKLLVDDSNAIMLAKRMKRQFPRHGNLFYIDTSGIVRIAKNHGKWYLADGGFLPSKVKGKTIDELWKEVIESETFSIIF